jgi:hypothetical protein
MMAPHFFKIELSGLFYLEVFMSANYDQLRAERDRLSAERDAYLQQRDIAIGERNELLRQRDAAIYERDEFHRRLDIASGERNEFRRQCDVAIGERNEFQRQLAEARQVVRSTKLHGPIDEPVQDLKSGISALQTDLSEIVAILSELRDRKSAGVTGIAAV